MFSTKAPKFFPLHHRLLLYFNLHIQIGSLGDPTCCCLSSIFDSVHYPGGAIISAPVSLIAESELSSWMLRPSVAVIAVLCSGVIQGFSSFVIAWGLHLKGPVYIAIFKPVSIAIAAFMSAIFLGDSLYLGSIIGVIIISIGFYAVIWGKAKEAERTTSSSKVPLLKVEDARISKRNARILKRK